MTDVLRHSKGYWRSIYIFMPIPDQWKAVDWFQKEMETLKEDHFSWCHYGEVQEPFEEAHITFRVNFKDDISYNRFKLDLGASGFKTDDRNYDEPQWVKEAYVLGTKLYKEVMNTTSGVPDVALNNNFLRIMMHGFCNDLHLDSREESEFYLALFTSYVQSRYGINTNAL